MKAETLKTIENYLVNGYHNVSMAQTTALAAIEKAVLYAWENWDRNIIATYSGYPEFVENWLDNEDLEADGFDEAYLEELFGN